LTITTIQIDKNTHTKLIKKRGFMEAETGKDVTFDDVINYLLEQDKKQRK